MHLFPHQVKSKVEEFKEHMPLIQTLFNPGLRERHWEQISDMVGFPIKQDDETTLSKFVDMNLDQYIPKFEGLFLYMYEFEHVLICAKFKL